MLRLEDLALGAQEELGEAVDADEAIVLPLLRLLVVADELGAHLQRGILHTCRPRDRPSIAAAYSSWSPPAAAQL